MVVGQSEDQVLDVRDVGVGVEADDQVLTAPIRGSREGSDNGGRSRRVTFEFAGLLAMAQLKVAVSLEVKVLKCAGAGSGIRWGKSDCEGRTDAGCVRIEGEVSAVESDAVVY